jgi:hypothetical protein
VSADGAVPAWYQVGDGNAADTQTYLAHLRAVREQLPLEQPLMVGDSKLSTRATCLGFCRVGATFIGPSSLRAADRAVLRQAWERGAPWQRLDLPPADGAPTAGRYWGLVHQEWLVDPDDGRCSPLRRLFVHSRDDRRALWTIVHRRRYPASRDPALVRRKVAAAVARVAAYVQVRVPSGAQGVQLSWQRDHARLREQAQFDGLYRLRTNLTWRQAQTRTRFRHSKEQSLVEGRFKTFKHPPLQVRPLWLHQPARLASLVIVLLVALLLVALIEREARHEVQQSGQVFRGLRPAQPGHAAPACGRRGGRGTHADHAHADPGPDPAAAAVAAAYHLLATVYYSLPHLRGAENEPRRRRSPGPGAARGCAPPPPGPAPPSAGGPAAPGAAATSAPPC